MSTAAYDPTSMPRRESQLGFLDLGYDGWRDRVDEPRPRPVEERMSRGGATLRVEPDQKQD